ncbi:MAG: glycosyltransferase family 2 protein [Weeksellaceae bacterium]
MKIHTVIVTYNATRNNWIRKCLASLESSTVQSEIIVIDNASTDQTTEIIKKEFPKIKLIESQVNSGFGKANNIGISEALKSDTDFVFLLNQDAWVEPDTIEKLRNAADKSPDFGIISPIHLNGNGNTLDFNFSKQIAPSSCPMLYSDFVLGKVENKVYETKFVCAAAWLVSKECLRKVGGFNPTFYHYAEDDNYVHRLHYKGLKIGIYPQTKIYHDRQEREKSSFDSREELMKRSLLLKVSNPNLYHSLKNELNILKNKRWKARLLNDKIYQKQLNGQIQVLEQNHQSIQGNLSLIKGNEEYLFLD